MSHATIRQLVEKRLSDYASTKKIRVAYENVAFTPKVGEVYLESDLTPIDTQSKTLNGGDHRLYIGIYQINIICHLSTGLAKANELAAEIVNLFPIYQPLSRGAFKVMPTTHVRVLEGLTRDSSYMLPVNFFYRADTN